MMIMWAQIGEDAAAGGRHASELAQPALGEQKQMAANTRLRAGGLKRGPDAGRREAANLRRGLRVSHSCAQRGLGVGWSAEPDAVMVRRWCCLRDRPRLLANCCNGELNRAEPYHSLGAG